VSREHARITWVGAIPQITDLGSANGTILNGSSLPAKTAEAVKPGDKIEIGGFQLTLQEPLADGPVRSDQSGTPLPKDGPALLISAAPAQVSMVVATPEATREYDLQQETVTIGRDPANDICIDRPVVSRRHAKMERTAHGYRIVDLGSANGLVCQHLEVSELLLAHGDVLRIADDVTLTYQIAPAAVAMPSPVAAEPWQPAPAEPGEPGEPESREVVEPDFPPVRATMIGLETTVEGLQRVDMRERRELTIGRSPENDLTLSYPTISRFHARISQVGSGMEYAIEDLGSGNGTLVNDEVIEPGKAHPLHPGNTVRIGPVRFLFAPESVEIVDESRNMRLDALHLNQFVGKRVNLLQDISLSVAPREFVAVVGVSGAGKSTLLNALAGFWPASDGEVLVNQTNLYRHFDAFRTDLGYVPQDDIIHKELTSGRALDYAARLRLPSDITTEERKQIVTEELETLGLAERRDVRVGRLSGGQRKRVSIGVERLTGPGLFFLDEATSGLDPGTENRLMRLLRRLADEGQTILLVTHATKNVMICDQVIFLAKGGRLAFFGPPQQALEYFGVSDFDEIYEKLESERSPEEWWADYRQSPLYRELVVGRLQATYGELLEVRTEPPAAREGKAERPKSLTAAKSKVKRPSPFRQFGVLTARYLEIIRSDRMNLLLLLLIAPVLGSMDLIAWPRMIFDPVEGEASEALVMLFLGAVIPFLVGALSSVREIVKERAIYQRERSVNLRIIPYLLSKCAVGLLFGLYHAAALLVLKLVAVDFGHLELADIALFYLIMVMAVFSGVMWGLLISAIAPREEQAMLLVIIVVVMQMVFSGGMMALDRLGTAGEVIGFATTSKWTLQALVDVTQVQRGDCEGPSLDDCLLSGIQAYETDPERQVMIDKLEERYGDVLEGDVGASILAQAIIIVILFAAVAVLQKRKDVI
jgi:ABC-type multidrug transport system ATPase subunit/pSer/pThr/pTyr-binding forkhead associated (FHA) protein